MDSCLHDSKGEGEARPPLGVESPHGFQVSGCDTDRLSVRAKPDIVKVRAKPDIVKVRAKPDRR